jgi:hypothetical protein
MAMSPTVPTILAAIQTAIKSAMNSGTPSNVLTVHVKRRFWRDADKFRSIFIRQSPDLLPGRVNGWIIYRESTRVIEAEERWRFYAIHRIAIQGYMGVADADSAADQAAFEAQVEAVRDNLRLNTNVFGKAERTVPDTEVLESSTPVTIGDVTAWHANLSLEAEATEVKSL